MNLDEIESFPNFRAGSTSMNRLSPDPYGRWGETDQSAKKNLEQVRKAARQLPNSPYLYTVVPQRSQQRPAYYIYVLTPDGEVIGGLDIDDHGKMFEVDKIQVLPKYQGQGLGMSLYGIALSILKKPLVAGTAQTPDSQRAWLRLSQIPGVQVMGLLQMRRGLEPFYQWKVDELGAKPWIRVGNHQLYLFPVTAGKKRMKVAQPKVHKIYGRDTDELYTTMIAFYNQQPVLESAEPEPLDKKKRIQDFIQWMYDKENITDPLPSIEFASHKESPQQHRTGHYDWHTNTMWIYTGHRNFIDVLRTVAHELMHRKQNQQHRIHKKSPPGSKLEREADSEAGYLMKLYVRKHPEVIQENSEDEISNHTKLDNILIKLCEMIANRDPEKFGMVAAAVIDPDNHIVAALNRNLGRGKHLHAEPAAMRAYEKRYGAIPDGSIIVTTLSPCAESMAEREGAACVERINQSNVHKVYCGYMDPTQHEGLTELREFTLEETANPKIRLLCQQIANNFLEDDLQEVKIDNRNGAGSVPLNQNVDYMGLRVTMLPRTFLTLSLPMANSANDQERIEYLASIKDTQGFGAPFLDIVIPDKWFDGDFSEPAQVVGHDGRHRMRAILKTEGDVPVETHLFPRRGVRNQDLTPEIIRKLQAGIVSENRRYVRGPLFEYKLNENLMIIPTAEAAGVPSLEEYGMGGFVEDYDPNQPPNIPRQKTDPTYNVDESATNITELWTQPYELTSRVTGPANMEYYFNTKDNRSGRIVFDSFLDTDEGGLHAVLVIVHFYIDNYFHTSGKGDAVAIFSTVVAACRDYLRRYKPPVVAFETDDPKKRNLYVKMAGMFPDYVIYPYPQWGQDPIVGDEIFDSLMHGNAKDAVVLHRRNYDPEKTRMYIDEQGPSNDTAISLSKLGKFHRGADTLAEFVPERAAAQYALHPDKWESTFYSLTNKDSDKLKYYGPKKISIPPGTLVGDMAIANKFYRAKTAKEKQQYAKLYRQSLKLYPVDVSEYRMPELLIPRQGVAEAFDQPYATDLEKSEHDDYDSLVQLPDGSYLSIMFNHQGDAEYQVEFWRGPSQEVTGEGDAQRIFATVLNTIQKFIKEHNPWRLTFSATKDVAPGQNSESRAKLYNRLVDRYAAAWGYDALINDLGDQVEYELTRLKPGVAEDFGSLSSMVTQDQAERNEYKNFVQSKAGGDWNKGAEMYAQLKKRPSDDIFGDAERLNQFMKMKFDFNNFTNKDWNNYWLLAQHCDDNRDFQKNALSIIKKYQGKDNSHYKYLYDRISVGLTGKQKYGTQNINGQQDVKENFADGKVKGRSRPGRVKRAGASCNGSVTDLRRRAKNASGERAKMYHWCANMKSGRNKHNESSEAIRISGPEPRAQDWIDQIYDMYPQTWQNNHVMPMGGEGEDQQFAMFELVPSLSKKNAVDIKWFQAYPLRQGVGSRAMQHLQQLAREANITLTLYPWDKGRVSQAKLMKFYRGQGFQPTAKGSKNMFWTPEKALESGLMESWQAFKNSK